MMKVTYISAALVDNRNVPPAITIDQVLCDGCNLCVAACGQGVLAIVGNRISCIETDACGDYRVCEYICGRGAIRWEYELVSRESKPES